MKSSTESLPNRGAIVRMASGNLIAGIGPEFGSEIQAALSATSTAKWEEDGAWAAGERDGRNWRKVGP